MLELSHRLGQCYKLGHVHLNLQYVVYELCRWLRRPVCALGLVSAPLHHPRNRLLTRVHDCDDSRNPGDKRIVDAGMEARRAGRRDGVQVRDIGELVLAGATDRNVPDDVTPAALKSIAIWVQIEVPGLHSGTMGVYITRRKPSQLDALVTMYANTLNSESSRRTVGRNDSVPVKLAESAAYTRASARLQPGRSKRMRVVAGGTPKRRR